MFRHLLLPLDGSRLAEATLEPAKAMALQLGARLTLLHVLERKAPAHVHGQRHLTDPHEAEVYLSGVAAALADAGVLVDRHSHDVPEAGVAAAVSAHAAEYGCDLIALATHGGGGMHDHLFGSIAQQVIGVGATPVLIIHPEAAPEAVTFRRLLVPLDGADEHESSMPVAQALAAGFGAEVQLLTAVPRRSNLGGSTGAIGRMLPTTMAALLDAQEAQAVERLEGLMRQFADAGVQAGARVARGEPAALILEELNRFKADLLVLSTHTRRGWAAFWSGSVAPKVLAGWRHPILLVRAAPPVAGGGG